MNEIKDNEDIYEVGFHLLPTLAEETLPELVLKIKDAITENEGVIISEDFPVLKQLAYVISKSTENGKQDFAKAYFGWIKFEIKKDNINKIEKILKDNDNILRFLVIKTVRGSTLFHPKLVSNEERQFEKTKIIEEKDKIVKEKEIDKSIDELVDSPL